MGYNFDIDVAFLLLKTRLMSGALKARLDEAWLDGAVEWSGVVVKGDNQLPLLHRADWYDQYGDEYEFILESLQSGSEVYRLRINQENLDWTKLTLAEGQGVYEYSGPLRGVRRTRLKPSSIGLCNECLNEKDQCICNET